MEPAQEIERVTQPYVRVIVGGLEFETFEDTIMKYPTTLLAITLRKRREFMYAVSNSSSSSSLTSRVESPITLRFDRNPTIFPIILEFYRTNQLIVPADVPPDVLKLETDYFLLPVDLKQAEVQDWLITLRRKSESESCSRSAKFFDEEVVPLLLQQANKGLFSAVIILYSTVCTTQRTHHKLYYNDWFPFFEDRINQNKLLLLIHSLGDIKATFHTVPMQSSNSSGSPMGHAVWLDIKWTPPSPSVCKPAKNGSSSISESPVNPSPPSRLRFWK